MNRDFEFSMRCAFCIMALAVVGVQPSPATPIANITVSSTSVIQGGSGTFEIGLTNLTGGTLNIAGFSFGISVPAGSGISLTGANFSTSAPYIFLGDSFDVNNGFPLTFGPPLPGTTLQGGDNSDSGLGNNILNGGTFALGRVSFVVSLSAAIGDRVVLLSGGPVTSLSDSLGNNVAFQSVNGSINILPEPGTLSLAICGLVLLPFAKTAFARAGIKVIR